MSNSIAKKTPRKKLHLSKKKMFSQRKTVFIQSAYLYMGFSSIHILHFLTPKKRTIKTKKGEEGITMFHTARQNSLQTSSLDVSMKNKQVNHYAVAVGNIKSTQVRATQLKNKCFIEKKLTYK